MKRPGTHRPALVLGFLGLAFAAAGVCPAAAGASLRPTGDVVERFSADPLKDARWFASGTWGWEPPSTTLRSGGAGSLLWNPGSHFTGTLALRLRLVNGGGAKPRARLIFAHDPATGAHRWLEIAAGNPGRLTLGQTGAIRGSVPGVLQSWRTPVAAGAWLDLVLRVAADKSVTVSLAGKDLFTAAAAPLAPGKVGFASLAGVVEFDEFTFTADPDGEPCGECHRGQPEQPLAANVYEWWDGRRWDAVYHANTTDQEGGHGDPGGEPAVGCAGANGCHDLRLPQPGDHRNGTREGRQNRTVNAFHLRSSAIVAAPQNPGDARAAFDITFCYLQCHQAAGVKQNHNHSGEYELQMAIETMPLPVDSDLTTRALTTKPDFQVCVTCHDPHGTGASISSPDANKMVRMEWTEDLCRVCHR